MTRRAFDPVGAAQVQSEPTVAPPYAAMSLHQSPEYGAALRLLGRCAIVVDLPGPSAQPARPDQATRVVQEPRKPRGQDGTHTAPTIGAERPAAGETVTKIPPRQVHIVNRRWAGFPVAWAPRLDPLDLSDLVRALPRRTCLVTTLDGPLPPRRRQGIPTMLPLMTAPWVAEMDVTGGAAARMARQQGKWRNRLRRALDGPLRVQIRAYRPDRDAALIAPELAQRKAKGYSALPPGFLAAFAIAAPDKAQIAIARHKGHCVAVMLLFLHPPGATYVLGWSNAEGRQLHAHTRLLWDIAGLAARRGALRLDLGMIDTDRAPGLARFKLGSAAVARPLGPTLIGMPRLWR